MAQPLGVTSHGLEARPSNNEHSSNVPEDLVEQNAEPLEHTWAGGGRRESMRGCKGGRETLTCPEVGLLCGLSSYQQKIGSEQEVWAWGGIRHLDDDVGCIRSKRLGQVQRWCCCGCLGIDFAWCQPFSVRPREFAGPGGFRSA